MSIGIIGGSDGPTSIFVTSSGGELIIGATIVILSGIIVFLVLRNKKKK